MTKGRVYAVIGGSEITSIRYFDNKNRRMKQIDLDNRHLGMQPHVHRGHEHQEYDPADKRIELTPREKKMVERVIKTWNNRNRK